MRHVTGRAARLISRLAAVGEAGSATVRGTMCAVVASAQHATAAHSSSQVWGSSSSSNAAVSSSRGWQLQRGFASAAAEPAAATPDKPELVISDAAVARLKELGPSTVLRVMVEGGGCSGFQYEFSLDDVPKEDDRVFEREGVRVVCDDLSLEFLRGATVDYESDLMKSAFVVNSNPNAASSCGCGSSFVAK